MRTAAPCSITARRRSSVPSTRPAANSTASSVNPSAEPSSYPQIPRTRQLRSPITAFLAETDLGPSPQLDIPLTITGKPVHVTPVGLTPEQLFQLDRKS